MRRKIKANPDIPSSTVAMLGCCFPQQESEASRGWEGQFLVFPLCVWSPCTHARCAFKATSLLLVAWVPTLSHIALSWFMCTAEKLPLYSWGWITAGGGAGEADGFWALGWTWCQEEPSPSAAGACCLFPAAHSSVLCLFPCQLGGCTELVPSSRAGHTAGRRTFARDPASSGEECCAHVPQFGSIMLVVALLVLRRKSLTAVTFVCPKQLLSSCTSYYCSGHFGWTKYFSSLILMTCCRSCH